MEDGRYSDTLRLAYYFYRFFWSERIDHLVDGSECRSYSSPMADTPSHLRCSPAVLVVKSPNLAVLG